MVELQDLTGVGPAREEALDEAGYSSVEDVADADHEELAEEADIPKDTALEFVVQAQNLVRPSDEDEDEDEELGDDEFDLQPKDVSDEVEEYEHEIEEMDFPLEGDESTEEIVEAAEESVEEDDTDGSYSVSIEFETRLQYDTFYHALMDRWTTIYRSQQPVADALDHILESVYHADTEVTVECTERELNELHSAVLQRRTAYQGENLIDHMDALREIETQINDHREEYLF